MVQPKKKKNTFSFSADEPPKCCVNCTIFCRMGQRFCFFLFPPLMKFLSNVKSNVDKISHIRARGRVAKKIYIYNISAIYGISVCVCCVCQAHKNNNNNNRNNINNNNKIKPVQRCSLSRPPMPWMQCNVFNAYMRCCERGWGWGVVRARLYSTSCQCFS